MKKRIRRRYVCLDIGYNPSHYPRYDNVITRILGQEESGSGMGFGSRDITFMLPSFKQAVKFYNKIRRLRHVSRISITVDQIPE